MPSSGQVGTCVGGFSRRAYHDADSVVGTVEAGSVENNEVAVSSRLSFGTNGQLMTPTTAPEAPLRGRCVSGFRPVIAHVAPNRYNARLTAPPSTLEEHHAVATDDDFEEPADLLEDEDDDDEEDDDDDVLDIDDDLGLDEIVPDDDDDDVDLEDDAAEEDEAEEAAPADEAEESLDVLLAREQGDDDVLVRLDEEPRDGLVAVTTPIGADEFTCTSCFLVKRRAQLANEKKMSCFDCA